jgi:hypothetical protein
MLSRRERRLVQGASLGKEAFLADSGRVGEVAARVGRVRRVVFSTSSLSTTSHVVDQGSIDVGATEADGIEEGIGVSYKILLVSEFIGHDLGITSIAEHHQPTRYTYCFSSCAPSHDVS